LGGRMLAVQLDPAESHRLLSGAGRSISAIQEHGDDYRRGKMPRGSIAAEDERCRELEQSGFGRRIVKWLDIYEWFAGKKAPKDWVERMTKSAPETRSAVEAARERFSVW